MVRVTRLVTLGAFLLNLQGPAWAAFPRASSSEGFDSALGARPAHTGSALDQSTFEQRRKRNLARSHAMTAAILSESIGLRVVGPPWRVLPPPVPDEASGAPRASATLRREL